VNARQTGGVRKTLRTATRTTPEEVQPPRPFRPGWARTARPGWTRTQLRSISSRLPTACHEQWQGPTLHRYLWWQAVAGLYGSPRAGYRPSPLRRHRTRSRGAGSGAAARDHLRRIVRAATVFAGRESSQPPSLSPAPGRVPCPGRLRMERQDLPSGSCGSARLATKPV